MKTFGISYSYKNDRGMGFAVVTAEDVDDCIRKFCEHIIHDVVEQKREEWQDYCKGNNEFREVPESHGEFTNRGNSICLFIVEIKHDENTHVTPVDAYWETINKED